MSVELNMADKRIAVHIQLCTPRRYIYVYVYDIACSYHQQQVTYACLCWYCQQQMVHTQLVLGATISWSVWHST